MAIKKSSRKKAKAKNTRSKTAKRRPSGKSRSIKATSAIPPGDEPNEPWLTIKVDGVDVGEDSSGSAMAFTASLWGESVGFGVNTGQEHHRVLYDGPYKPGPYQIAVTAEERGDSDDEFTDGNINFDVDHSTLQGSGSTTITQKPGDKDDKDAGDEPNDPDDPDETASFTIRVSAEVEAVVEITDFDILKRQVTFDLLPENLDEGTALVTISSKTVGNAGKQPDVNISQQVKGGRGRTIQFEWDKFPQDPQMEFHAQSVTVFWNNLKVVAREDTRALDFVTYGVFRISRFFTPDDDQWTGPTESVTFGNTRRNVHTNWISRVRCEEGKGRSLGDIVNVRGPGHRNATKTVWVHKAGTQRLNRSNEGAYVPSLTVDRSLAKNTSDRRFRGHDQILLSTDPNRVFAIEDTGNWTQADEPPGRRVVDHFDRYVGFAGPGRRRPDFPMAFVVKLAPG